MDTPVKALIAVGVAVLGGILIFGIINLFGPGVDSPIYQFINDAITNIRTTAIGS